MDAYKTEETRKRSARWAIVAITCLLVYVLSSGPTLATAFWLREATTWDGFYAAMLVYYPLLELGHGNPIDTYIEWWVHLFGTVGPC